MGLRKLRAVAALGAAVAAAVHSGGAAAKVTLEAVGRVSPGVLQPQGYQLISLRNGSRKVAALTAGREIGLWDLASGREELRLSLPPAEPGRFLRLTLVEENAAGDLVAVVGDQSNVNGAGDLYVVNLTSRKLLHALHTGSGGDAVSYTTRTGAPLIVLTGSMPAPSGQPWSRDFVVVDPIRMAVVAENQTKFSGDVRIFEDKQGNLKGLITGYEVVALWWVRLGAVEKLIERTQPSLWPRYVTGSQDRQWLHLDSVERPGMAALYPVAELLEGRKTVERYVDAGHEFRHVDGRLIVIERDPSDRAAGAGTRSRVRVRDFETQELLGEIALDGAATQISLGFSKNGDLLGLLSGPTQPNHFASSTRMIFANLTRSETRFQREVTRAGAGVTGMALGPGGLAVLEYQEEWNHPVVLNMGSGDVLHNHAQQKSLAGLVRLENGGRIVSVLADFQSGEVCAFEWTDGGARTCFPDGLFLKHRLSYDYALNAATLGSGEPFLVPIFENVAGAGEVVTGLAGYRLK